MKFTKEEAFEKLKGILTNNGKKTLRMSEKSIEKQLETLMPLVSNEEMELSDFVEKVKNTFSVMNSNVEKDNSDFVKEWEKNHPAPEPPKSEPKKDDDQNDAMAALLKRIDELEKKNAERDKEVILAQKRKDLLKAMKDKGIKDENWSKSFIEEISITEDFDVDAKADAYLKIYNKSQAGQMGNGSTPFGSSFNGGDPNRKDPLAAARAIIEQRNKEREGLLNKEK